MRVVGVQNFEPLQTQSQMQNVGTKFCAPTAGYNKINQQKQKMPNNYNPKIHHRKSIRLKDYDYTQDGYYFVTICAKNKTEYFGEIINGKMILNEYGEIANQCWVEIPEHFLDASLDEHIIMPNHIHGIIVIETSMMMVGAQNFVPLQREQINKFQHIVPRSLGSIIRGFKIGVTKWCRNNNYNEFQWQKNYYDRIIRNEKELDKIRKYIFENPLKWEIDKNNPENLFM